MLMNFPISFKSNNQFGYTNMRRVYFGNWLRDFSQLIDTGTLKFVSATAIQIIVAVLGMMEFGYATKEFEVKPDALGVYRPEEHIG
jgi:hypothetical protein